MVYMDHELPWKLHELLGTVYLFTGVMLIY